MTAAAPQVDSSPPFTPFAAGLAHERLMLQRCDTCGTVQLGHIRCDACLGSAFTWVPSDARGVVHTHAVMHRAYHPAFAERIPYPIGIVELDEGPHVAGGFAIERSHLRSGLRVKIAWDRSGETVPLCFVEDTP
jgi:uncharacterized protein